MVIFRVQEGNTGRSSIGGLPAMQLQCFYIKVFPLSPLPETLLMDGVVSAVQSQEVNNATPNVPTMNVPHNEVLYLPQAPQASDSNFKEPNITKAAQSSPGHLLYAVEILIFAVIGWAWVAVRELMSGTPVMDVSVLLSVLVCSIINLLLALVYYTTDQFRGSAKAFFNLSACLCLLYAFSLAQSTTNGRGPICCDHGQQRTDYSLRLTYRAAYFGGLTLHQPPAAITLAYLVIFLVLASAQARACMPNPRDWLMGKSPLVIACLLGLLQAMFVVKAPVCKDKDTAVALITLIIIAWFFMIDISWILNRIYGDTVIPGGSGINFSQLMQLIQIFIEFFLDILISALAAVLAVNMGSGDALLVVLGLAMLWQVGDILMIFYRLQNPDSEGETRQAEQATAIATPFYQPPSNYGPTPPMLLPGMRELRRARHKKAW